VASSFPLDISISCIYTYFMSKLVRKPAVKPPRHYGYVGGSPVQIRFGPAMCLFLTPYPVALDKELTAPYPGYIHMPSYKSGQWDGHHHFITRAGQFQTGLLPVIYSTLTIGKNPLKDNDKIVTNPVKVEVIVPEKYQEFYHPGLERSLSEGLNLLEYLTEETGMFAFPTGLLKSWTEVKATNPLATRILSFARRLHFASKNGLGILR
jgi:hypothetical protein